MAEVSEPPPPSYDEVIQMVRDTPSLSASDPLRDRRQITEQRSYPSAVATSQHYLPGRQRDTAPLQPYISEGPPNAIHEEGNLTRKHELEAHMKKATNRKWDKLYVVLDGTSLSCYKDQKLAKQEPNTRIHHETAMDLAAAICENATDYTKTPHVFRLRLANGAEYLFMAKDQVEMEHWINRISATSGSADSATPGRSQALPERTDEQKKSKKK